MEQVLEERIKSLFKKGEAMEKRIEKLEDDKVIMYNLDKNLALITKTMTDIANHNKKQDALAEKQDARMNEQHEINVKVSDNLSKLAGQYNALNVKVDSVTAETKKLAVQLHESEEKNKIDLRDGEKIKASEAIKQYAKPFSLGVGFTALLTFIIELIKIFKG